LSFFAAVRAASLWACFHTDQLAETELLHFWAMAVSVVVDGQVADAMLCCAVLCCAVLMQAWPALRWCLASWSHLLATGGTC
jgi:hypothetical protein